MKSCDDSEYKIVGEKKMLLLNQGSNQGFGLKIETTKLEHKVHKIEPKSSADLAGLKVGDCIIAVNGKGVIELNHKDLLKLIKSCSDKMEVTIASDTIENDQTSQK